MNSFPDIIYRVHEPSALDQAPHATICLVEDGSYYIQMSNDDEPDWQLCINKEHAYNCRQRLLQNTTYDSTAYDNTP